MSKKKKKGLPYNNLVVVTEAKKHFLSLCAMLERMGKLFVIQAKAISHPQFSLTPVPRTQGRMLTQYREILEEMKNIGTYLDFMPGKNVMKSEEPEEKEVDVEVEKTFVSNIEPGEQVIIDEMTECMKKQKFTSNIEPTIPAAVETDYEAGPTDFLPHKFKGRHDRPCMTCQKPDRHIVHRTNKKEEKDKKDYPYLNDKGETDDNGFN